VSRYNYSKDHELPNFYKVVIQREIDGHVTLHRTTKSSIGKMRSLSYNMTDIRTRYTTAASSGIVKLGRGYTNPEFFEAKCDFGINTDSIAVKFITRETQLGANGFHWI